VQPIAADRHYDVFPRTIAEIVDRHGVDEAHVTLTQGRWRQSEWGSPLVSAPSGAEVWAWFRNGTQR
jgi:phosphatidylinositol glycan class T